MTSVSLHVLISMDRATVADRPKCIPLEPIKVAPIPTWPSKPRCLSIPFDSSTMDRQSEWPTNLSLKAQSWDLRVLLLVLLVHLNETWRFYFPSLWSVYQIPRLPWKSWELQMEPLESSLSSTTCYSHLLDAKTARLDSKSKALGARVRVISGWSDGLMVWYWMEATQWNSSCWPIDKWVCQVSE